MSCNETDETVIEFVQCARPQTNQITQSLKSCGDAKPELFPGPLQLSRADITIIYIYI